MTNVIEGTPGAEGQTVAQVSDRGIAAYPTVNNGNPAAAWSLDDLLREQPQPTSSASVATSLGPPLEEPAASAPAPDDTVLLVKVPPVAETPAPDDTVLLAKIPAVAEAPTRDDALPQAKFLSTDDAPPVVRTPPLAAARSQTAPNGQVLPVPPLDEEKYRYVRRSAWLVTLLGAASFPLLLYSQVRMMLQYHWFLVYGPFLILSILFLFLPIATDALSRGFDFDEHRRLVASWRPARYPSVDVFLPVCGEPEEVLRNTWKYVSLMSSHYQGAVTCYVLDDSRSPKLKAMAREFGFVYATRPNRGWFKKSGNLWFGYQVSYSEFILLLDADFAPRHDFLDEVLPYMDAHPDVGIVQTPQFFRVTDDQTWIERGAGAIQELFYRSIQAARARKGGSICVGSCALYRRTALKGNSGMTLAEHSEDMLTGFDLRSMGWRLYYIPVALSTGNCPNNVLAFLNQQYRWCCGTVGLLTGKTFWGAKLPLYTRVCYISGLVYYVYTALFTFLMPALAIAILTFVPEVLLFRNMIFMVPALLYAAVVFPSWHHAPFRLEAWAVRVISGWAHFFAYWDAIRGKRLGWKPSGGAKQDGGRRFWACFIIWTVGSSLAWTGLAFYRMITMQPANFAVLFGLGLFELLIAVRIMIQPAEDTRA